MSEEILEGIAASDFHFDGLNKHFPDANERIIQEMEKIYQYALKNGIKHIFMPGDLADTPNLDWDTYGMLFDFFMKYDGLIHSYYIAGNHDFADIVNTSMNFLHKLSKSRAFKTLHIFLKPERREIDGIPVNFLPYPCLETLSTKKGAVNFAHVEYNGAIGDNGRSLKTKHELAQHKNDFTVSGHIHQYQYMETRRAVYCGNPFQKNFGESLPKGFIHFRATLNKNKIDFKHNFVLNKPNFELVNLHIDDINDFKKLQHSNNIRYKLHVDSEVPVPADLMLNYPNITGGIFVSGQKKAKGKEDEEAKIEKVDIDLTTGLKQHLVAAGLDKKMIKRAKMEVQKAKNALGII